MAWKKSTRRVGGSANYHLESGAVRVRVYAAKGGWRAHLQGPGLGAEGIKIGSYLHSATAREAAERELARHGQ